MNGHRRKTVVTAMTNEYSAPASAEKIILSFGFDILLGFVPLHAVPIFYL